jgi:hypothetical protein
MIEIGVLHEENQASIIVRTYKFIYKVLGILFHRYLYSEGEKIEFIDTEILILAREGTSLQSLMGNSSEVRNFLSTPLYEDKLSALYDYHQDLANDKNNDSMEVIISVEEIKRRL